MNSAVYVAQESGDFRGLFDYRHCMPGIYVYVKHPGVNGYNCYGIFDTAIEAIKFAKRGGRARKRIEMIGFSRTRESTEPKPTAVNQP
jgi:hypothetical protein